MPSDDVLDRELSARFEALRGSIASIVPVPSEQGILSRGSSRRRNGQAGLTALAFLAVMGVGAALLGPLRPLDRSGADDDAANRHRYAPPAGSVREPVGLRVPAGFLPSDTPPFVDSGPTAALRAQCPGGPAFTTNHDIVARRRVVEQGAPWHTLLLVYGSGLTASRAFDEYRAEAVRCERSSDGPGTKGTTTEDLLDGRLGAQALRVYRKDPGSAPVNSVSVAVRYGGSLLVIEGSDADVVYQGAGQLERRLCVFAASCAPRNGRPAAQTRLTAGGKAYAVVLAVETDPDARRLGNVIAAASEAGFRASVTSVDCDRDAREGLGLPDEPAYHYVGVYFDREADATAFAESLPISTVATIPVRTYCLT